MPAAVERIVVQATLQDKQAIAAKAKKLDLPVAELMRRGAFAYEVTAADVNSADEELAVLADAAKVAADRAAAAIDGGLDVIAASNRRIAAMEAEAAGRQRAG